MGMSYQREYLLDSALFYLKRADLLHPNDREINQAIYPIAAELREWEVAARAVNVLIETGDSLAHYRLKLADLNLKMGNYIVAFIHMRKLLESSPDDPDRYYQMAVVAQQVDSIDVALAVVNDAIDRFGEQSRFLQTKGVLYTTLGEYEKAERILRRLLASESSSLIYKVTLANALAMQPSGKKKLEAFELYKQVQGKVSPALKVDSILTSLQQELN
jgi:tetratricopeptide (TPR) repeat protein